ncbi:NUDIX domain-containing protein [Pyrococcus yayanosii]|uniref:ADP-ribose pyrophosphatase (MutT) n=1 Tax=Pyrococcus yayanosii (strain CH1 / JCM 16557) TaxID=529709 RepID=F8AF59_PYRYC|nr:NUDIX hydrolase [Pyrococcus yayanosii]AEH23733.1 ADP-ribose pyrophosphatase (MutT) [Pyrococcus yayanosii CH1]
MERYVLLVKALKGVDVTPFRERVKALAREFGLRAEMYRCIGLTVDLVILYEGGVVLVKRGKEPYKDHWALPGGFVEYGETVEEAAVREAKEETGLDVKLLSLVGVYSRPDRDPRGHTVTIAFLALGLGELKAGDDAREVRVFPIDALPRLPLAFDHADILRDALGGRIGWGRSSSAG